MALGALAGRQNLDVARQVQCRTVRRIVSFRDNASKETPEIGGIAGRYESTDCLLEDPS